jgi:polysaccharide pyruvyl transferase WcaK-like protein
MINIIQKNFDKVYFWPQSIDDLDYFRKITPPSNNIEIVSPNLLSYDKLLSSGNIDYIGNRLHGGIFALQHQVRSIIIGIDYRAKDMHEAYSFPYLSREKIDTELEKMITSNWQTEIQGIDFETIEKWKRQFK